MTKQTTLYLQCPKCQEIEGVLDIPIIDDKDEIYLDFPSDTDNLEVRDFNTLLDILHKEDFICTKCEHVFNYDDWMKKEKEKYDQLNFMSVSEFKKHVGDA